MDNENVQNGDEWGQRRRAEIEWEWHEPSDRELLDELLEPYRHLLVEGHPFEPVARKILERPLSYDLLPTLRRSLDQWVDSTTALVQRLKADADDLVDLSHRGRRALLVVLGDRYPHPLHRGREKELLGHDRDTDLSEDALRTIIWQAAIEAGADVMEEALADLPGSLSDDRAFRNALNEAATELIEPSLGALRRDSDLEERAHAEVARRQSLGTADLEARVLARLQEREVRVRAGLTDTEARVWGLYYDEQLDRGEIAERLSVSRSTVRVHLHNARQKLREAV